MAILCRAAKNSLPGIDIYNLFPFKTAYCEKRKHIFLEKYAFYGIDMELEPEP
jgi:hypothetical protein